MHINCVRGAIPTGTQIFLGKQVVCLSKKGEIVSQKQLNKTVEWVLHSIFSVITDFPVVSARLIQYSNEIHNISV